MAISQIMLPEVTPILYSIRKLHTGQHSHSLTLVTPADGAPVTTARVGELHDGSKGRHIRPELMSIHRRRQEETGKDQIPWTGKD
ncbi:hypothetical protein J6590_053857 [Homalodisca vitripennis]|nr:hypothetical protein J6590_053857 [Homalodisca vitripennis]